MNDPLKNKPFPPKPHVGAYVELRWQIRAVPPGIVTPLGNDHGYMVLQYRTKKPDSTLGWMPADPRDLWTEWQDVPLVD